MDENITAMAAENSTENPKGRKIILIIIIKKDF